MKNSVAALAASNGGFANKTARACTLHCAATVDGCSTLLSGWWIALFCVHNALHRDQIDDALLRYHAAARLIRGTRGVFAHRRIAKNKSFTPSVALRITRMRAHLLLICSRDAHRTIRKRWMLVVNMLRAIDMDGI